MAKNPTKKLIKALRKDPELFRAWKANIAMSIYDAYRRERKKSKKRSLSLREVHTACNEGAANFINLLITK